MPAYHSISGGVRARLAFSLWVLTTALCALGTQPPSPEAIKQYLDDGSFEKRAEFIQKIGNHKVRPDVARHALARLGKIAGPAQANGTAEAPLPAWQGMPTKGTNNLLVLLIDFPDYSHVNDASLVRSKLFGNGNPSEFPLESLRSYYLRSSYDQLYLQGNVLGWYRMAHERNWYTTQYPSQNEANRAIILEALQSFDPGHDFSQYDNDGNGLVDYFAVIWAGPDNGWGGFWWGYQWELFNPITLDGVNFTTFSWQWESRPVGTPFEAETIIHETGHALGLPDYYDYDPSQGPGGGVGGLDMMDAASGDHNAFSKFMLDWLTPRSLDAGATNISLVASSYSPEAIAVMPNYAGNTPYSEYFIIENRFRTNNDIAMPGTGLLIWHVDATPDERGQTFLYDNSYTARKLLRLMEADGLEEIENGDGWADAGDYFGVGKSFGQDTIPNSRAYDGNDTGVTVDTISGGGVSLNARFAVEGTVAGPRIRRSPTVLNELVFEGANPANKTFGVWATGGNLTYAISDDAVWLTVSPQSGSSSGPTNVHTVSYSATGLAPGTYTATITLLSPGALNSPQTIGVTLTVMGDNIGRAVEATNLVWTAGGSSIWFEQSTVAQDGVDAAQSGVLGNHQTNWIETTVQGPGRLSFWWKVSSELGYDFLRFMVDGTEKVQRISGPTEWRPNSVFISSGTHTLRWAYTKDVSLASGADAGWVDLVEFVPGSLSPVIEVTPASITQVGSVGQDPLPRTIQIFNAGGGTLSYSINDNATWLSVSPATETSSGQPNTHTLAFTSSGLTPGQYAAILTITAAGATNSPFTVPVTLQISESGSPLGEAVDLPSASWVTTGDAPWTPEAYITHDGLDAASSGNISHGQFSILQTTLDGPGKLSYWWKSSTEAGYDFMQLYVDNQPTGLTIDGETDWVQQFHQLEPGTHTLVWVYVKDGDVDSGWDTVWLDQVTFTPGGSTAETLVSADFSSGLPAGWQVVDNASYGAVWRFHDPCQTGNWTGGSGPFAIADSDCEGNVWMDTELVTPEVDCTSYTNVILQFGSDLVVYSDNLSYEIADVDVQLNGSWMNVWRRTEDDYGPRTYQISIPDAAGQPGVKFRFHYFNAFFDLYWAVDNVVVTGQNTNAAPRNFLSAWRQAWEDYDQHYSQFGLRGINWQAAYTANTNRFAAVTDPSAFANELYAVLQQFQDWQVSVKKPDGSWLHYGGTYTNNRPTQPLTRYRGGAAYQNLKNANAIHHGWVASNLAHVVVTTLDDSAFSSISDSDIDSLFQTYKDAKGLILDLRWNLGGNETNAWRIAGRFTDLPRIYGYTRTRLSGSDHNAFTPFAMKLLNPSAGTRFSGNVVCLTGQETMGSAEWLALMMASCPQVTLLGDHTRGAAAILETFSQPDVEISYTVPRTIGYDSEQAPFQAGGVLPGVQIPPGAASYDPALQRDHVLESAILQLSPLTASIQPGTSSANVVLNWPAFSGTTYTLLRSTTLEPGSWTLAPGWSSNRLGFDGQMSYTNSSPDARAFYRLLIGN